MSATNNGNTKKPAMRLYAIWCYDLSNNKGDWYRELPSRVDDGGVALLVFTSQREAKNRAAQEYGFDSYAEAKKNGWVEVRELYTKGSTNARH